MKAGPKCRRNRRSRHGGAEELNELTKQIVRDGNLINNEQTAEQKNRTATRDSGTQEARRHGKTEQTEGSDDGGEDAGRETIV